MPPDPMQTVLGRLGYVPRDDQAVSIRQEPDVDDAPTYPQVVIIQGHSAGESWIRDHAGQLLLAAGVTVVGLTALVVIALVAIVTAVAMVTCVAALAIARGAASQGSRRGRGR